MFEDDADEDVDDAHADEDAERIDASLDGQVRRSFLSIPVGRIVLDVVSSLVRFRDEGHQRFVSEWWRASNVVAVADLRVEEDDIASIPVPEDSHYAMLGLTLSASKKEIRDRFYMLAKLYHPDTSKAADAHDTFTKLAAAYEVKDYIIIRLSPPKPLTIDPTTKTLSDPEKRLEYNKKLFVEYETGVTQVEALNSQLRLLLRGDQRRCTNDMTAVVEFCYCWSLTTNKQTTECGRQCDTNDARRRVGHQGRHRTACYHPVGSR